MSRINNQYTNDINAIMNKKLHTKEDIARMKAEGVSTKELKELKKAKMYCSTASFKRISANKDSLIKQHLKLALSIATKYHRISGKYNVPLDDVVGAANLGLAIAAQRFTEGVVPEEFKDIKFSTYAWKWIRKYVMRELTVTSEQLAVSERHAYEKRTEGFQYWSKDKEWDNAEGQTEAARVNDHLVSDLVDGQKMLEIEDDANVGGRLMKRALNSLSKQERTVISALYGIGDFDVPLSNKEIASTFKLSKSTVSNTTKRALGKLYMALSKKEKNALTQMSLGAGLDMRHILCG